MLIHESRSTQAAIDNAAFDLLQAIDDQLGELLSALRSSVNWIMLRKR